jgi:hypothetical protein
MELHMFNKQVAIKYGIDCAIMIQNLCFWIKKNQANNKNLHEDFYWTYNSERAFCILFPYWTRRQIQNILKKLQTLNLIKTGNYNKLKFDRTKWYTIIDPYILNLYEIESPKNVKQEKKHTEIQEQSPLNKTVQCIEQNGSMQRTKRCNALTQNVQPIPYINTYINTDIKTTTTPICKNSIEKNVKEIKKDVVVDELKFNELKNKIDKTIGTITTKGMQLILGKKIDFINLYINNFDKFKTEKSNKVGFFIKAILEEYPIPKEETYNKKPIQSTNYKQREYTNEDFNILYDNVQFIDPEKGLVKNE